MKQNVSIDEIMQYVVDRLSALQTSLLIHKALNTEQARDEFAKRVDELVVNGSHEKALDLINEQNNLLEQNSNSFFVVKGELTAYVDLLSFLGVELPQTVKDSINSLNNLV